MARPIRAIYVEDESTVRELLPIVMDLAGIEIVAVCKSAEELLELRGTAAYMEAQVFIFDVRLPGITGLELAAKMRDEGEVRPIVAVSAWPVPLGVDLEKLGVEYLRKPFDFAELEETIRTVVGG